MRLKILHGYGTLVVVNERGNDPYTAKGNSQSFNIKKGRCERHYEKSYPRIEKP